MNLYIIRHGLAAELGEQGNYQDSQRPLTEVGRKKVRKIARGLRALEVSFDLILSSPYLRARETAEILAAEFEAREKFKVVEALRPPLNFPALLSTIHQQSAVENLALVGHEPDLSGLISLLLTGETSLALTMKKGGVCALSVWGELRSGRCAQLEWLATPTQLLGIET
jgi:phosphohistidine phosphatase